jgi:hypothetical protein
MNEHSIYEYSKLLVKHVKQIYQSLRIKIRALLVCIFYWPRDFNKSELHKKKKIHGHCIKKSMSKGHNSLKSLDIAWAFTHYDFSFHQVSL